MDLNQFAMQDYMMRQQHHADAMRQNQNILLRQVFTRAKQHGCINILPNGEVQVINLDYALNAFSHQPDLLNPALSQGLHQRNKELLEQGLTEAYRNINR